MILVNLNIKAVLFDLDGTLTQYNLDYQFARVEIVEEINNLHLDGIDPNLDLTINAMLYHLEEKMTRTDFTVLKHQIYGILKKYELEFAKKVKILPNVQTTLKNLKDKGLKTAIVTNNCLLAAKETITRFHINNLIDVLVTRDDAFMRKPDGAIVKKALARLGINSGDAVFIGDSVADIIAARNSDVVSVAIPSGPTSSKDLLESAPDYMIYSVSELSSLIDMIQTNANPKDKKTGN